MRPSLSVLATALALGSTAPAVAQQVGEVGVDWFGNDIVVEAIKDPKVEGVTCHVSYFDRGMIDGLVARLERRMAFDLSVTDAHLFVSLDGATLSADLQRLEIPA